MNKKNILIIAFSLFIIVAQAQKYKRVVSLASSLTKNIYLLGAEDILVGCTSYCKIAKGDKAQVVGSSIKVNFEKLYSLKPDLVIATELSSSETINMLKKLKIKYKIFPNPKNFNEICNQFTQLSSLLGKQQQAEKIIKQEKHKLQKLKKQISHNKKIKIFIQLGANPLFAVIPNTFMHDYIDFVGGINIANNVKTGVISKESVLLANPDYIFVTTMGNYGKEEIKAWNKYKTLKAVKNKHVYAIDSDIACTPTPKSFTQTIEIIINYINKT